jgi:hypothetical protein
MEQKIVIIDHMSLITSKKPTVENEKNMEKMHEFLHDFARENNIKPLLNFNTMTKAEAIQAMEEGKKVTHRHFSPGEWMTMKKSVLEGWMIHLEDGVMCKPAMFWSDRTNESWENDYKLYI